MRKSFLLLVVVALGTVLSAITPASAAVREYLFSGGNASASWVTTGQTDASALALTVTADNGTDYDDYAGAEYAGVPAAPPATAPSFSFRSSVSSGGSGGSPRLVILFGSGSIVEGVMELFPFTWAANTWTTIGGTGSAWDARFFGSYSGPCTYTYQGSYATGTACFSGSDVLGFLVVSDSGWANPGGYTHLIDDIHFGDLTITAASCTRNATGDFENGPVSAPVHDTVEPAVGDFGLSDTVHGVNCDVVVPLGL